jgi:hypothetical protein
MDGEIESLCVFVVKANSAHLRKEIYSKQSECGEEISTDKSIASERQEHIRKELEGKPYERRIQELISCEHIHNLAERRS